MRAGGLPFHLPHVGRNLQAPPNSKHGALAPTAKVSKVGLIESRKVGLRQGSKHITMDAIRVNWRIGGFESNPPIFHPPNIIIYSCTV